MRRAFFSATLATEVEEWASLNFDNPASVTIGQRNSATDTVEQTLVYTGTEKGKLLAFRQLIEGGKLKPPVLIFVQEKDRAKELFTELIKEKIHVDVIHSERSQLQRDNTVRAFRAGQIWVLICTELMGRGIDFKGVNLVINYDFPPTAVMLREGVIYCVKYFLKISLKCYYFFNKKGNICSKEAIGILYYPLYHCIV